MVHGQSSLRGVWVWAHQHWTQIWQPLGFLTPRFPALTTIWSLLARLEPALLEQVGATWVEAWLNHPVGGISADGKVLRGSRRDEQVGIQLVALLHQPTGVVLSQQQVTGGDGDLGALLRLLAQVPLSERILTCDAGLLQSGVTRVVPKRGGAYLGVVKQNQREMKAALDEWVHESVTLAGRQRTPDARSSEKSRGRLEERELWVTSAGELAPYLAREWGWWHARQVGWIRRKQRRRPTQAWQEQELTFVTSLTPEQAPAPELLRLLRQHWLIENRVHYVRDVSYGEDRLHARRIGQVLAWARNMAMSLIRQQRFKDIPDGWRFASAHPQTVLGWLTQRKEN
jgi:predicted transposase YbfD/YdcC